MIASNGHFLEVWSKTSRLCNVPRCRELDSLRPVECFGQGSSRETNAYRAWRNGDRGVRPSAPEWQRCATHNRSRATLSSRPKGAWILATERDPRSAHTGNFAWACVFLPTLKRIDYNLERIATNNELYLETASWSGGVALHRAGLANGFQSTLPSALQLG